MTEKQYGGATGRGTDKLAKASVKSNVPSAEKKAKQPSSSSSRELTDNSQSESYENYIKAGKIAKQVVEYAKSFIKPKMPLLEIAEKIEEKIIELGARPAFPVNLSINEIAAHCTPSHNDATLASGLLKVDIGAHVEGYVADTAFSLDLDNSEENKKLIQASEKAVKDACDVIKEGIAIREVGKAIEKAIKSSGFSPINNLSGHSIEQYELHSGTTIPNHDNSQEKPIEKGVYAIEPFATSGLGSVKDGKPSGIYRLEKAGNVRDNFAREVLAFAEEEYKTLPFCLRWLVKKFDTRAVIAMKRIEDAGLVHHYPQLIEISGKKVSQAEHTIIVSDKKTITTL